MAGAELYDHESDHQIDADDSRAPSQAALASNSSGRHLPPSASFAGGPAKSEWELNYWRGGGIGRFNIDR